MNLASVSLSELTDSSKRVGHRLLAIAENRLELLTVEVQQERNKLIQALLLVLGLATLGLLAGIAFSALVVVLFWAHSPVIVLTVLVTLYAGGGVCLYVRLRGLLRDWEILPATLDQLRKDRECVEQTFD